MQSLDEPVVALPVMNPLAIKEDYNPMVEDELLKPLGEMTPENTFVLVTVTVPEDIKKDHREFKSADRDQRCRTQSSTDHRRGR